MSVKKGLGKGLGALITQTEKPEGQDIAPSEIDINKIEPNPAQPRKHFDKESLAELAQSITEHGILQPIIVTKTEDGRYFIVAGERRWRAARIAKKDTIPAVIREFTDSESLQVALIENLQREDINPIEEALSYRRLMDEFFFNQEDIAGKVGKSPSRISSCLALLSLCDRAKALTANGHLNAAAAKALLQIKDEKQQGDIAEKIAEDGMTAAEADKYIKSIQTEKPAPPPPPPRPPVYDGIERELNIALGTKVKISQSKKGGKIQIDYYSQEELDRLVGILKSFKHV